MLELKGLFALKERFIEGFIKEFLKSEVFPLTGVFDRDLLLSAMVLKGDGDIQLFLIGTT
jgi:hypothetical protein